jgi:RNA polymerase sigma-70 factor (ECF subfamily)
MDDRQIVDLYWARAESAVEESSKKYGKYCYRISYDILHSHEDAEECVNDTYLRAWNAMPPHRPVRLATFLGKITRNLSIDRALYNRAKKRCAEVELALDELAECITEDDRTLSPSETLALRDAINGFLATLPERTRALFLRRYWHLHPTRQLAHDFGMTEGSVKALLHRTRAKLKKHLEKEEIPL